MPAKLHGAPARGNLSAALSETSNAVKMRFILPALAICGLTLPAAAQPLPGQSPTTATDSLYAASKPGFTIVVDSTNTQTPAGSFETLAIRRSGDTLQSGDYKIWYAPALGWYVRFEGEEKGGGTRRIVHVAKEIRGR
jgi:hypothetical protein